ncbi:MAG TPA: hypothetical protein PLX89_23895 [Verrucomicrobiota bacterium]|nr:hypothetical protein [Verrucomicrobiales bacterium]HRI16052.1 hypothetical protein [Verrucomicrobiota bacterium]
MAVTFFANAGDKQYQVRMAFTINPRHPRDACGVATFWYAVTRGGVADEASATTPEGGRAPHFLMHG